MESEGSDHAWGCLVWGWVVGVLAAHLPLVAVGNPRCGVWSSGAGEPQTAGCAGAPQEEPPLGETVCVLTASCAVLRPEGKAAPALCGASVSFLFTGVCTRFSLLHVSFLL